MKAIKSFQEFIEAYAGQFIESFADNNMVTYEEAESEIRDDVSCYENDIESFVDFEDYETHIETLKKMVIKGIIEYLKK